MFYYGLQRSEADGVLIAEFAQRKKLVKQSCENHGAYTTKEKVQAKQDANQKSGSTYGVESDVELWNLLKKLVGILFKSGSIYSVSRQVINKMRFNFNQIAYFQR